MKPIRDDLQGIGGSYLRKALDDHLKKTKKGGVNEYGEFVCSDCGIPIPIKHEKGYYWFYDDLKELDGKKLKKRPKEKYRVIGNTMIVDEGKPKNEGEKTEKQGW